MRRLPVVITSYCGEPNAELKIRMTGKLCEAIKKTGHYVCLATHSPMPVSIQEMCDGYIYDADNSFQINGLPTEGLTHGMAELKSVHNALNYLERFGFTDFFKLTYDCDPTLNYTDLISRAQFVSENYNKSLVCSGWGHEKTMAFLLFYSKIDYFRKISSLSTPEQWRSCFEEKWYENAEKLGLQDQIFQSHVRLYDDYLGYHIRDFAHQGGTEVDNYPY